MPIGTKTDNTFTQNAFEVQLEKGFYNQFFLLASASGFTKPTGAKNPNLPVMDQADLAYLGTFRTITAMPEWALALQFARNMAPILFAFSRSLPFSIASNVAITAAQTSGLPPNVLA